MTPPPTISISGVTPAQIANLVAALKADRGNAVATPSPNNYSIMGHNITVAAAYAPATSVLLVQIVSKPWFVSTALIHEQLIAHLG
jgi:hypothetical protein